MIKFASRVIRVNAMGRQVYVEVKNKVFEEGIETATTDDVEVKVFDTDEEVDAFISGQMPLSEQIP